VRAEEESALSVFAGLTRIAEDHITHETEPLRGRGHYLEPLAMTESNNPVTIAALPHGQLYATNARPRKACLSVCSDAVEKMISIEPGVSALLVLNAQRQETGRVNQGEGQSL